MPLKTVYIKQNEYRVAVQGKSWKFKLINAIDLSLSKTTNKSRNNNIFDRIIDISSIFSNPQIKRPIRTIQSYRSLSKQTKKEYMKKKANSSSFNLDEEEEI